MTEGYNPFPGFFVADTICSLQNADTSGLEDGCLAYVRANQSYYAYGASFAHAPAPNGTTVLSTFNGPAAVQADGSPCTGEQSHAHTAGGPGRWILTTLGYGGFQAPFKARAVQSLAVAHLNAASTSADGVTLLEGDVVLLTAQTPGTDNGPYVVGPVVGPAAPLTRPFWWSPDTVIPSGTVIEVGGEGTLFKNSSWKVTGASFVVETGGPGLFPQNQRYTGALGAGDLFLDGSGASGHHDIGLYMTADASVQVTRRAFSGALLTVEYEVLVQMPGQRGAAALRIQAQQADGSLSNYDVSTLSVLVNNW